MWRRRHFRENDFDGSDWQVGYGFTCLTLRDDSKLSTIRETAFSKQRVLLFVYNICHH